MEARDVRRDLEELHAASFAWSVTCCRGDAAEAEDVLQTAYLKVLDGRARFAGRSSFKTWFFAVVRRTALERWRRRRLRRALLLDPARREPPVAAPDPQADAARGERSTRVRRALARLSQRQRQVLDLVFYQELSVAEAAVVLGISVGSARVHYARGKRRMAGAMIAGGGGGGGRAMSDRDRERRLLESALAESHRATRQATPPFAELWRRAAAEAAAGRRRRPWLRPAVAAAAVILVVAASTIALWLDSRRSRELDRALAVATAVGEWRAPLDFLLDTPGREWLAATPRWQPRAAADPAWGLAPAGPLEDELSRPDPS